jgi:hypothetical protein
MAGGGFKRGLERVRGDLRDGRNREAYTIFMLGIVLTGLGVAGSIGQQYLLSGLLLAVTYLVFRSTVEPGGRFGLADVLRDRESFVPFPELLRGASELWVYGPSAVNILAHAADIRQQLLAKGGSVRVIVQDPQARAIEDVRAQLDDNLDFSRTLESSLATLDRLGAHGDLEYRLLPFSPGFSIVVVDAHKPSGFLILELHGFMDDNVAGRMHLRIPRAESLHWFGYWADRFQAMWEAARKPVPTPP